MKEVTKKEINKILQVILFLVISIIFVLPYLVQISTYFHEKAHQKYLTKYGVENFYQLNLIATIPGFFNPDNDKLGVTRFSISQYLVLDKYQRTQVNLAGIMSDLKLLFLIGIYLSFANIYLFYKLKYQKSANWTAVLAINWILFMWLLVLIQITIANVSYSAGDVYQLIRFLRT